MKLMKPILTAGAAVAMLCACGGGKRSIKYEDFVKKIPNNNVFYNNVHVTGKIITGPKEDTVDVKFKFDQSNMFYYVQTEGDISIGAQVQTFMLAFNGKNLINLFQGLTDAKCTENPYSIEFQTGTGPKSNVSFTFTDEFAVKAYKMNTVSVSNKDSNPYVVSPDYDLQFENSGDKHNI